jgi:hypothetical protein
MEGFPLLGFPHLDQNRTLRRRRYPLDHHNRRRPHSPSPYLGHRLRKKAAPNLYAGEQRSGQKRGKHKTLDGIGDQAYIRRSTIMGNDLYPDLLESHSNCSATGYSVRLVRQRRLTSGRKVRRVKDMRNMRAVPHHGNPLGPHS